MDDDKKRPKSDTDSRDEFLRSVTGYSLLDRNSSEDTKQEEVEISNINDNI
jgi:hypothetical protein